MTLRTGKERLWKPCRDCDEMMPRHSRGQQVCEGCKKKNMTEKIRRDMFRMGKCGCGMFKFKENESCWRCIRKKDEMIRTRMRLLGNEINR